MDNDMIPKDFSAAFFNGDSAAFRPLSTNEFEMGAIRPIALGEIDKLAALFIKADLRGAEYRRLVVFAECYRLSDELLFDDRIDFRRLPYYIAARR